MTDTWTFQKLRDIANIRVSNVDKKTNRSEKLVKLCNYMDVYSNEYITNKIQFMEASANRAEIDNFSLSTGDVVITKDSETPDDIGVSAVIYEKIDDLVCGYHLAIIRPDKNKLDSVFLAKCLSTSHTARYFALHASGSTRFGLPIGAIELAEIPTPPKEEQAKIAAILSTIDLAIEQTEAIIAKQQRIKTGLMQDLLTKGIDEEGNVRSEATHAFKDSPLGRIPMEWNVKSCSTICKEIVVGIVIRPAQYYCSAGVPVLRSANVKENIIDPSGLVYMLEKDNISLSNSRLCEGNLVTVRTGYPGTTAVIPPELDGSNCVDIVISRPDFTQVKPNYLALWINSDFGKKQVLEGQGGLAQQHFNVGEVRKLLVKVPKIAEQQRIENLFILKSKELLTHQHQLQKLQRQKTGLMQDLLTGKVRVTELLQNEEKRSLPV